MTEQETIKNRPYTAQDIKVERRAKNSTALNKWETYYFSAKGMDIFPLITKAAIGSGSSVFRFWSKHCESLQDAKQHIADCLNSGKQI